MVPSSHHTARSPPPWCGPRVSLEPERNLNLQPPGTLAELGGAFRQEDPLIRFARKQNGLHEASAVYYRYEDPIKTQLPPVRRGTRPEPDARARSFTLIELLIVVVMIGLLATIALPQFDKVRERAFNATVLSDIRTTIAEVERYAVTNYAFPSDENDLFAEGLTLSADVSFMSFSVSNPSEPGTASIHVHIEHAGSSNYYHFRYPDDEPPELRLK